MFPPPPIQYEEPLYRPPSEWKSLLIQLTIGCSNNKCTYCDMYRSKTYRVRPIEDVLKDLVTSSNYYKQFGIAPEKIFLCDGDALGAPQANLERVLDKIKELFPENKNVGIYATAQNILEKTDLELDILSKKGLSIAYLGLESGDDKILHMIVKGNTAQDMKQASLKIMKYMKLSTIAMLGVGGKKYTQQHIENTAKILGETSPNYFSFLTTFAVPGTPYFTMVQRGLIEPLSSKMLLTEMHDILQKAPFTSKEIIFRANHVSNQNPIGGTLPKDLNTILSTLKNWRDSTPDNIYPKSPRSM